MFIALGIRVLAIHTAPRHVFKWVLNTYEVYNSHCHYTAPCHSQFPLLIKFLVAYYFLNIKLGYHFLSWELNFSLLLCVDIIYGRVSNDEPCFLWTEKYAIHIYSLRHQRSPVSFDLAHTVSDAHQTRCAVLSVLVRRRHHSSFFGVPVKYLSLPINSLRQQLNVATGLVSSYHFLLSFQVFFSQLWFL